MFFSSELRDRNLVWWAVTEVLKKKEYTAVDSDAEVGGSNSFQHQSYSLEIFTQ